MTLPFAVRSLAELSDTIPLYIMLSGPAYTAGGIPCGIASGAASYFTIYENVQGTFSTVNANLFEAGDTIYVNFSYEETLLYQLSGLFPLK